MNLSLIIPCRNAADYLGQALRSAMEQSLAPAEVIVVDDGSTDGSREVARAFGQPVRLVAHPGRGAPSARNFGYARASGDAVMFLDADDVLGPDALAALAAVLTDGSVACCPWFRMELDGTRWVQRPATCAGRKPGEDPLTAWLRGWYHPPCSVLWSRAAFEATGGWDPRATVNNDGDLMMRAMVLGVSVRTTTRGSAYYRRLPHGQLSLSGTRFSPEALRARIWVLARIAQQLEQAGRLDGYRPALGFAFRALAADCRIGCPELASACHHHAAQFGDHGMHAAIARAARHARSRLGRWRRRHTSRDAACAPEVTYGLAAGAPTPNPTQEP